MTRDVSDGLAAARQEAHGTQATNHQRQRTVAPGDEHGFAQAIRALARQPDLRREMGARAHAYAEANLGKAQVLGRLLHDLERLTGLPGSLAVSEGNAVAAE